MIDISYDRITGNVTMHRDVLVELLANAAGTPRDEVPEQTALDLFEELHGADDAKWDAHFRQRFGRQP